MHYVVIFDEKYGQKQVGSLAYTVVMSKIIYYRWIILRIFVYINCKIILKTMCFECEKLRLCRCLLRSSLFLSFAYILSSLNFKADSSYRYSIWVRFAIIGVDVKRNEVPCGAIRNEKKSKSGKKVVCVILTHHFYLIRYASLIESVSINYALRSNTSDMVYVWITLRRMLFAMS